MFGDVVVGGGGLDGTEGVVGFEEGDVDLFDGASEVLESECGVFGDSGDVGIDIGEAEIGAPCDSEAADGAFSSG